MYRRIIRPLFFLFPAERAHYLAMQCLAILTGIPGLRPLIRRYFRPAPPSSVVEIGGLKFSCRIGLAAGFDKNAKWIDLLECLGFGFVEIGTVTPRPQPGNPTPRLFRLPKDRALINRMGFNNDGVHAIASRLKARKSKIIVGANIGKNKDTPNERAVDDYLYCFEHLRNLVDYFAVNVSSPNTPGLRELQDKKYLLHLLHTLQAQNLTAGTEPKPIFLKVSPDLSQSQSDDVIEVVKKTGITGIIATNTTVTRAHLRSPAHQINAIGDGGLSGAPLNKTALEVVRYIHSQSRGAFAIIGCGGVFTAQDARVMFESGACLVQVYTGFIYEGPAITRIDLAN